MEVIKTDIPDLYLIKPKIWGDQRGYFFESYSKKILSQFELNFDFVQDNQSSSEYGVIRGLHYQLAPYSQTKLVRILSGRILDVVVDIRKGSPTFGKSLSFELSSENKLQLLVPKGFAHGFSVLSENAEMHYKCDDFYNPEQERGIIYNDSFLNIDWMIPNEKAILSSKDLLNKPFDKAEMNFIY